VSGAALPASFYARPTPEVARRLLGHILVSTVSGRRVAGRIVETEAYVGPHDPACHGYGARRTPRNASLFGAPGTAYVYFTYGMHWCLNAVTESEGYPAAVLIRALEPILGLATMRRRRARRVGRRSKPGRSAVPDSDLCSGPAKLCEALGVTRRFDGVSLQRGVLRIVRSPSPRGFDIIVTPRIGITRAVDWPLRFLIKDSLWVSQRASLTPSFALPKL
jgi:DNA-3-methyladenine glycosylase